MTAKSLLNSMPVRNLKRTVKENKKLMIVISILQALGIPMCVLMIILELYVRAIAERDDVYYYGEFGTYAAIGILCFGAAVIAGMIAAIAVYQELWKKTKVDMICSLPLTGSQRFFSHYLAGAVIYLLPYLVAAAIGWIILLVGSCCIDFPALDITQGEFLAEGCKFYALGTVGMFLLMWMFYTTTALIIVCCGTQFESIYTTLLLNCLVPGTFAAVLAVFCSHISALNFEYLWYPIGYTSPIGGLIYLVYTIVSSVDGMSYYGATTICATQATDHALIPAFIRWSLILTVIIAVCLVAAWQLYKRRLAESVGKPYVYMGVYYFMLTMLTILILCVTSVDMDALGAAILFSAIVYFVMEVIRKRGFRRFWLSFITYAATVVLTFGIFKVVDATDAFGAAYRVPSTAATSSLKIGLVDINNDMKVELEYTDKDVISAIREVHKDIAADMKAYGSTTYEINEYMKEEDLRILDYTSPWEESIHRGTYRTVDLESISKDDRYFYDFEYVYDPGSGELIIYDYNYASEYRVEFFYYDHLGSITYREYEVNAEQYIELLQILYGTELYKGAASKQLSARIEDYETVYNEALGRAEMPQRITVEMYSDLNSHQALVIIDSKQFLAELEECWYKDLQNVSVEEYLSSDVYGEICDVTIPVCLTETIALLEDNGFHAFNVAQKFAIPDLEYESGYLAQHYDGYNVNGAKLIYQLYAPEDYVTSGMERNMMQSKLYVREGTALADDSVNCTIYKSLEEEHPELYALLAVANHHYKGTEDCYLLSVNGMDYAIEMEYAGLVEAFLAKYE